MKTILNKTESHWSQPPPGTELLTTGTVQKGDWFYIEQFGAWANVPECAVGENIETCGHLVARGPVTVEEVFFASLANYVFGDRK